MAKKQDHLTKRQVMAREALTVLRTQTYNWALSVGMERTEKRWRFLNGIQPKFPPNYKVITEGQYLQWAQRQAIIDGLFDAALAEGWADTD